MLALSMDPPPQRWVGLELVRHIAVPVFVLVLPELDIEMARLEEYISQRLWEATTAELNERIAAKISAAEAD